MRRPLAAPWVGLAFALLGCAPRTEPTSGGGTRHHSSIAENVDCENCHTTEGWALAGAGRARGTGFDHARTGFPLTGRHTEAGCTDCHAGNRVTSRECSACHEDTIHQGRLGTACDGCHSSRDFRDVRAVELHRSTQLPLTGMHVLADCTECHRRTTTLTWSNVPADCWACHENDYRSPDTHPPHGGTASAPPFSRECTLCHTAMGWSPAIVDSSVLALVTGLSAPADHDLAFPISSGKHAGLACESCHVARNSPRTFRCTDCHAHSLGALAAQHHGIPLLDGPGCLSCHPGGSRR
ncbi:MAG: hypothetical protein U0230_13410 [Polyangiales bacterium]